MAVAAGRVRTVESQRPEGPSPRCREVGQPGPSLLSSRHGQSVACESAPCDDECRVQCSLLESDSDSIPVDVMVSSLLCPFH